MELDRIRAKENRFLVFQPDRFSTLHKKLWKIACLVASIAAALFILLGAAIIYQGIAMASQVSLAHPVIIMQAGCGALVIGCGAVQWILFAMKAKNKAEACKASPKPPLLLKSPVRHPEPEGQSPGRPKPALGQAAPRGLPLAKIQQQMKPKPFLAQAVPQQAQPQPHAARLLLAEVQHQLKPRPFVAQAAPQQAQPQPPAARLPLAEVQHQLKPHPFVAQAAPQQAQPQPHVARLPLAENAKEVRPPVDRRQLLPIGKPTARLMDDPQNKDAVQLVRSQFVHNQENPPIKLRDLDHLPEWLHTDPILAQFKCTISFEPIRYLARDPEANAYYERAVISEWIRLNGTSPMTRKPLSLAQLIQRPEQKTIDDRLLFYEKLWHELVGKPFRL